MNWSGRDLARITGGALVAGGDHACTGVSTDTRTLGPGQLFIPLVGERFDGHDFIEKAVAMGCAGCLVQAGRKVELGSLVHVEVPDTLRALGDIASAHLELLSAPVVAITGSNGKTSTKELTATVLGAYGRVAKNRGNFNNLVGLPLTLLEVTEQDDFVVVEMGMNAPGEIARLTEIADPDIGVVTTIDAAHLHGVGSIEGVARAKGELFAGLGPGACAVVNALDRRVRALADHIDAQVLCVGTGDVDVSIEGIRRTGVAGLTASIRIQGRSHKLELRALGQHEVYNAGLALGVAVGLGLDPVPGLRALAQHTGVPGRLQWKVTTTGVNVIDDTYNANPGSMRAALKTLAEVAQTDRRIAVLGDMLELGPDATALHEDIGAFAADLEVDYLFACGEHAGAVVAGFMSETDNTVIADDAAELAAPLLDVVRPGDWVLVKGSRGARMERLVEALGREVQP